MLTQKYVKTRKDREEEKMKDYQGEIRSIVLYSVLVSEELCIVFDCSRTVRITCKSDSYLC